MERGQSEQSRVSTDLCSKSSISIPSLDNFASLELSSNSPSIPSSPTLIFTVVHALLCSPIEEMIKKSSSLSVFGDGVRGKSDPIAMHASCGDVCELCVYCCHLYEREKHRLQRWNEQTFSNGVVSFAKDIFFQVIPYLRHLRAKRIPLPGSHLDVPRDQLDWSVGRVRGECSPTDDTDDVIRVHRVPPTRSIGEHEER
jgi:hypothetical protein